MELDFDRLWFVSFADSRLITPLKRIRRQARRFGFLSEHIVCCDETGLDIDFREKMKRHLVPGSRGYGYWCWKPQIILQVLRKMKDGDILLYTDVGCHLNSRGRSRFLDYVSITERQGVLGFQSRLPNVDPNDRAMHFLREREWTKGDLLDFFHVRDNSAITETGQIGGTVMLAKKTESTVAFFMRFKDIFIEHFNLIDDTASSSQNFSDFRENRHDQSAFSILYKLAGYESLTSYEYMRPWIKFDSGNPRHQLMGNVFFKQSRNRPIYSMGDKAVGWRALVPCRLKPFLWSCIRRIKR